MMVQKRKKKQKSEVQKLNNRLGNKTSKELISMKVERLIDKIKDTRSPFHKFIDYIIMRINQENATELTYDVDLSYNRSLHGKTTITNWINYMQDAGFLKLDKDTGTLRIQPLFLQIIKMEKIAKFLNRRDKYG